MLGLELALILILILFNGFLAMAELAVVSARRARLQPLAQRGSKGAQAALDLAAEPGRFLSSVQIGITLVGILVGAYGGATLSARLEPVLAGIPVLAPFAGELAVGLVVATITGLSVIVGELVPKQIALARPERIAAFAARPMRLLATIAAPVVWLLDTASRLVLWLTGLRPAGERQVTDEEIRALIAEATRTGLVHAAESEMIGGVMRLADRPVAAIMTPRSEVVWLDLEATADENRRRIAEHGFDRYVVARGSIDRVEGVLDSQDLLKALLEGRPLDIAAATQRAVAMPESAGALKVMAALRSAAVHLVLVVDEFGSLQGIVTTSDVVRAIVGALPGEEPEEAAALARGDGTWLIDGAMSLDAVAEKLGLALPERRDYHTLAGLVLALLRRLPQTGDHVEHDGWRLEVVDMDGRRIDKVMASRIGLQAE